MKSGCVRFLSENMARKGLLLFLCVLLNISYNASKPMLGLLTYGLAMCEYICDDDYVEPPTTPTAEDRLLDMMDPCNCPTPRPMWRQPFPNGTMPNQLQQWQMWQWQNWWNQQRRRRPPPGLMPPQGWVPPPNWNQAPPGPWNPNMMWGPWGPMTQALATTTAAPSMTALGGGLSNTST